MPSEVKVAWRAAWSGFPDIVSIIAATTASQAKNVLRGSLVDVGYLPKWVDLRVQRAAEYDLWASRDGRRGSCWAEEFVRKSLGLEGDRPQP